MTAPKEATIKTIPAGTEVTWHYRSAIGHGTVDGIHKKETNADNTMYSSAQQDHHPGEPVIVVHSGKASTRASRWNRRCPAVASHTGFAA